MSGSATYKLAEAEQQKRLDSIHAGPVDEDDIRLTRLCIERSISEGATGLTAKLLDSLAKLSKSVDSAKAARGQLLDRNELQAMTQKVVSAVIENFEGCDDYENRIDSLIESIHTLFEEE